MKKQVLGIILSILSYGVLHAQVYMYGTTSEGGANNLGTIYRVDENGQNFENLFDFTTATGGTPYSGLTLDDNGMLYGFTTTGGQIVNPGAVIALGTFYQFDPLTNNYSVIEYIDDQSSIGNTFNNSPTKGSAGLIYMVSEANDLANLDGILSSYNPTTSTFTTLDTLVSSNEGQAKSKLLFASDGNLYVTTLNGGTGGYGAIVKYDVTLDQLSIIHSSPGTDPGLLGYRSAVNNPLFEASNGKLYGTSRTGGLTAQTGNVFSINKDGTNYQNIHSFASGLSDEGFYPEGGFVEKNGLLYSTTPDEFVDNVNSGIIYTIDINTNAYNSLYTLDLEGADTKGTFVESSSGRLFVTCLGGPINSGSIIELNTTNNAVTQRHSFMSNDGLKPRQNELAVVDMATLGLDDINGSNSYFQVYPNPSSDFIELNTSNGLTVISYSIIDLSGKVLKSTKVYNSSKINVQGLSIGTYFIKVNFDSGDSQSQKIVIKN